MADRWEMFKQYWKLDDEDDSSPITDASSADDSLVEDAIERFQKMSKEITDITVALSSSRSETDTTLSKLREAVTLAYGYCLNHQCDLAQETLEKAASL